jgi:hypothetical protein
MIQIWLHNAEAGHDNKDAESSVCEWQFGPYEEEWSLHQCVQAKKRKRVLAEYETVELWHSMRLSSDG